MWLLRLLMVLWLVLLRRVLRRFWSLVVRCGVRIWLRLVLLLAVTGLLLRLSVSRSWSLGLLILRLLVAMGFWLRVPWLVILVLLLLVVLSCLVFVIRCVMVTVVPCGRRLMVTCCWLVLTLGCVVNRGLDSVLPVLGVRWYARAGC